MLIVFISKYFSIMYLSFSGQGNAGCLRKGPSDLDLLASAKLDSVELVVGILLSSLACVTGCSLDFSASITVCVTASLIPSE